MPLGSLLLLLLHHALLLLLPLLQLLLLPRPQQVPITATAAAAAAAGPRLLRRPRRHTCLTTCLAVRCPAYGSSWPASCQNIRHQHLSFYVVPPQLAHVEVFGLSGSACWGPPVRKHRSFNRLCLCKSTPVERKAWRIQDAHVEIRFVSRGMSRAKAMLPCSSNLFTQLGVVPAFTPDEIADKTHTCK